MLELDRWGVKNDGTDAENTTNGINSAIVWASQNGYTEIILPKGTYLIDEKQSIEPQSFMTLNLNGSTLKVRANNLIGYNIVSFDKEQKFARLTNGKIEGDRYAHDYSSGGTHEFGVGVTLKNNVNFITLDNLEIFNTTGDAIMGITSYGGIPGSVMPKIAGNLEVGGISTTDGTLTTETNRIRTTVKLPMTISQIVNCGYFGLYGDSYGGLGAEITTDIYDVIFYRSDDTFHSSVSKVHFFEEIEVPAGVSYAKVVIHQSVVPSVTGCTITVRTPAFPKNISIEKCDLHHCRRLGVAICGVKQFYVRDCLIHHNSGVAPAGGIDIEDGYDINQYIFIEGNSFYDNGSYSLIVVSGRHIHINRNRIVSDTFTINRSVDKVIMDGNYFYTGGMLSGEVIFSNNHIYGSRILLTSSERNAKVSNCIFHNSTLSMERKKAYVIEVDNCKFYNDPSFYNTFNQLGSTLIFGTEPQTISNCIIEGYGKEALVGVIKGASNWILNNVTFLNTKHPQDRITGLPPGKYRGCTFINSGRIGVGSGVVGTKYEFEDCRFEWDSYSLFYVGPDPKIDLFKISNSSFTCSASGSALFLKGKWGIIKLSNNMFSYPNSTSVGNIIDFWSTVTADSILIEGNVFTSNKAMGAVNTTGLSSLEVVFKDNFMKTVVPRLADTHIKIDNYVDGVFDPYYRITAIPTSGKYRLGQILYNKIPIAGGYLGWVCTREGTALSASVAWKATTSYTVNSLVSANNKVYKCIAAGTTGTTAPSHTTGTAPDGTVTWEYVDTLAVFNEFGLISK